MRSSNKETIELTLSDGSGVTATDFGDFLILKCPSDLASLGRSIFDAKFDFVDEVIATEVEICVAINDQFDHERLSEFERLEICSSDDSDPTIHELGIWFGDEFDDWGLISQHTGIAKDEYVKRLLTCEFSVAMNGFLPGFVYLKGLPVDLQVPRKENPATRTLANTFAVGGKYAGVYSLPSAAGWNCVGRIAHESTFLDSYVACNAGRSETQDDHGGSLTFTKPGMLTLVQDRGRRGLAYFAIPRGGVMDSAAAGLANTLLDNSSDAPVIECNHVAPTIRFDSAATICLTGANMKWHVGGKKVSRNQTIAVEPENVLTGSAAKKGCRAYIGIAGEIQTTTTFGSSSCYMPANFGGNDGKPFSAGDKLHWSAPTRAPISLQLDVKRNLNDGPLNFLPGPEFEWLDEDSQKSVFTEPFQVTATSDRMGARLAGPKLSTFGKQLSDSVPLLPGMIQLTPGGQCIVVLQDGQTTGGYPRIGYLDQQTIEQLNQTPIGRAFSFSM